MFKDFDAKYTPKTLADIVFQSDEARKTIECLTNGQFGFPMTGVNSIILYGTYGTGKSALAKILPQVIETANGGGEAYATYFNIAQGGDNGASVIDAIKGQAMLVPYPNNYHYFVLDEVDNLRTDSMSSLKVAMGTNAMNCIYIMTTNKLVKVDDAVQNRSVVVEFNAAPSSAWLAKFKSILADYGVVDRDEKKLLKIIDMCDGSARQILLAARKLIVEYKTKAA